MPQSATFKNKFLGTRSQKRQQERAAGKKFVMKICAKVDSSFGCNGAICHGSHSEATSKLQENQTTFAIFVKPKIVNNVV